MDSIESSDDFEPGAVPILPCQGWWEQPIFGRQPMHELRMALADGKVRGVGSDIVGDFVLNGLISPDGKVVMIKQYIGKHSVKYTGNYDGEGLLWGTWKIGWIGGGRWCIRLGRSSESESTLPDG